MPLGSESRCAQECRNGDGEDRDCDTAASEDWGMYAHKKARAS